MRLSFGRAAAVAAGAVGAAGLTFATVGAGVAPAGDHHPTTVLYTMSDASAAQGGNAVLGFASQPSGGFSPLGSFSTGGNGSGAGLGSQGALALAGGGGWLLAVNAGSNSVSAFRIGDGGALALVNTASSGGTDPISVSVHGRLVEVLDAGSSSISGLRLGDGGLSPLTGPGDTASLSREASSPEQISFTPDGRRVIVTEKGSDTIDTFEVSGDGNLGEAVATTATGAGPYGFDFDSRGRPIVSDAAEDAATSYRLDRDGTLDAISDVPNGGQAAPCWLVVGGDDAYTANAHVGTISAYEISESGQLTLLASVAATAGGIPNLDLTIAQRTLYNLVPGANRIVAAPILDGGALGPVSTAASSLPSTATGLVSTSVR
ncbi:MAG TPA: beta-propeller fold lactonase family protein [Candidatus Binatia bacterium]|nr:beta-propeller fold lactonase family protein [Candidatus Binatia bacterium]